MTGGWAATNTLRDIYDAVSPYAPDAFKDRVERREKYTSALALVETALTAAEKAIAAEADGFPAMATLFRQELAAALRAVREGK